MSSQDKNRYRKTYSFFREQPVYASGGGGGGGGGGGTDQFWYSTTADSIYSTGSVLVRGDLSSFDSSYDLGTDVFFYVSGSIGSSISNKKVSVFGGDLLTSGSLKALSGMSGSLTKLLDGTSYLIAGSNVSIATGSNGSITISSSATVGAAGNNTEIQYNNAGAFGASSNLSFNSMSNVMSLTGSFGMKGNIIPDEDTTYTLGTSEKRWGHIYTGDLHLRNDRGDWTIVEEPDYLCVVNNKTGKKYKMMLEPLD
jgi:hypothetical protein